MQKNGHGHLAHAVGERDHKTQMESRLPGQKYPPANYSQKLRHLQTRQVGRVILIWHLACSWRVSSACCRKWTNLQWRKRRFQVRISENSSGECCLAARNRRRSGQRFTACPFPSDLVSGCPECQCTRAAIANCSIPQNSRIAIAVCVAHSIISAVKPG